MSAPIRVSAMLATCLLALACQAPASARTYGNRTAAEPAAPASAENAAKPEKRRSSCAFRRQIRGYSVIDRNHFVLDSGRNDFLVTLTGGCLDLDYGIAIAIKSRPSAGICVEQGDEVILGRFDSCLIRRIEPVDDMAEARKLVAERAKKKKEKKEPKPQ